jgi:Na+-transporting NADH:ubiquinone oxidoreductase subunit NqrF
LPEFNCRREWVLFQIVLAVAVFTSIVVTLSGVILLARSRLVETGTVQMVVNDDRDFEVPAGVKLLTALSNVEAREPAVSAA